MTPTPVGWWVPADKILSGGSGALTGSSLNQLRLLQVTLPEGWTLDTLGVVVTAVHAGTQPTMRLGVYPSNADGRPDLSNGPIAQGTYTTDATGLRTVSGGLTVPQPGGVYYLAHLMNYSTAPTTFPSLVLAANVIAGSVAAPNTNTLVSRGLLVLGQTIMGPVSNPTFSTITDGNTPFMWARRSA